jgi:ribonuclease HI
LLPVRPKFLRYHLFGMLMNSLYSDRRYLPVLVPDKRTRDATPRTPCWICGQHDDGVDHVYGDCEVVCMARQLFTRQTGVDITPSGVGAGTEADAAFLNFAPSGPETTMAIFCFNKAVWDDARSYFRTLGRLVPAHRAAGRLANVANAVWDEESHLLKRGAEGGKKKRSPAVKEALRVAAMNTIATLAVGGMFVYTDGASWDNPGPAGAGVYFTGSGHAIPAQAWSLGRASNNVGELFAIGAAAESIMVARAAGLTPDDRSFILSDSDNGLGRLAATAKTSDDVLLTRVRRAVSRCRATGPLGLIWVPGHCGVPGNEAADSEATEGAVQSMRSKGPEPCGDALAGWDFLTPSKVAEISSAINPH